ncbi:MULTISPECIES: sirohydrochlorin chelatase [Anaeromyxobacter]|uniref:sirohydrochlorin chelatase n=1 Tax=Anaeromyxobacter TaxID=161492 RepID=UPI001F5776B2|nr:MULTISPECIES: sirohydrochlorin chelatase [unclassified Anaeromyxobacter]
MERTAVLILGHGSRVARANAEFEALVGAFRRRRPDLDVGHAYVELAAPLLADALAAAAARADRVVLLPMFLLTAGHLKDDVPAALAAARAATPRVRFDAAGALGVVNRMTELVLARSAQQVPLRGPEGARTALLVVGRGSSDPDANSDLCKLTRILGERAGFARAEPCFIAVTSPLFERAVEDLAKVHDGPILVQPYFLFEGLLMQQLAREVAAFRSRHPGRRVALAPHLGPDARLVDLLEERLAEVLGQRARLPCDTCPRSAA